MRVDITGVSGFIGAAVTAYLASLEGVEVIALTRTIPSIPLLTPESVVWRQGDLSSPHDVAAFVEGLDCVVHLAHTNTPLTSNHDLASDAVMNLVPTLNLVEGLRAAGRPCHVVYASSGGAVYRPTADGAPVDEDAPLQPNTSYAIQKLAAEQYLRLAGDEGWLTATALRMGNAYGALLPPQRMQGFLGVAISQHAAGRPIRLFGDPGNVRDYVHLDDVCRVYELTLGRRRGFEIFNVGTGRGASVAELVELLGEVSGRPPQVERLAATRDTDRLPHWVVLDCSRAAQELGWEPQVPLAEGIRRMWVEATGS